jgi:hypothetical protein
MSAAKLRRIEFQNFKTFPEFSLDLQDTNILFGPNNAGKSTVIGALRALDSSIRAARSRAPTSVYAGETKYVGWRIPSDSIPMSLENVHTNYSSVDSTVRFKFSNKNQMTLLFPTDGGCILTAQVKDDDVYTAAAFKRHFPFAVTSVPVLGPLEHHETLRGKDTVSANLNSHRASRNFRNYWYYNKNEFASFSDLIARTWAKMKVNPPEHNSNNNELSMFCEEGRLTRELYWLGFGFQIWCQLLTHLARARDSSLFIVDEPETYLHPDVQRQLVGLIREADVPVVMATHSTEIISESEPTDLVFIDKTKRNGERLKNIFAVQGSLEKIGSGQNITLTALARTRKVIFVEGAEDYKLLRRFALRLGLNELSAGVGVTMLKSEGFGSWQKITTLAAGISNVLGAPLTIAAVYDSDYFCGEQIEEVLRSLRVNLPLAHVHRRKEIENYLLVPTAIARSISRAQRAKDPACAAILTEQDVQNRLDGICAPMKAKIQSQIISKRAEWLRAGGRDSATITAETIEDFEARWADSSKRLELVPGKLVLAAFREKLQHEIGITISNFNIIENMHRDEIPEDMQAFLKDLEVFRRRS